ncbi:MAG: transposase [Holophagaceae bacterium]|nr:transposase [Holophagaceae bacterium]
MMGELGDLRAFEHPKQLSHFVGVAPVLHTSGTSVGARPHEQAGQWPPAPMLYMGALAAIRPTRRSSAPTNTSARGRRPPPGPSCVAPHRRPRRPRTRT